MIDTDNDLRPWIPPGTRPFQVGDHVRIRLSGECHYSAGKREGYADGHLREEDDRTGIVIPFPYAMFQPHDGHTVAVEFTTPIHTPQYRNQWMERSAYAPNELELLEVTRD